MKTCPWVYYSNVCSYFFLRRFCGYLNNCAKNSKSICNNFFFFLGFLAIFLTSIRSILLWFIWFYNGILIIPHISKYRSTLKMLTQLWSSSVVVNTNIWIIFWSVSFVIDLKFCIFPFIWEEKMHFFLIADKLLAIVFRILVSNYIFVHLERDIKSFTVWKSC